MSRHKIFRALLLAGTVAGFSTGITAAANAALAPEDAVTLESNIVAASTQTNWMPFLLVSLHTAFEQGATIDELVGKVADADGFSPAQKGKALRKLLNYPGIEEAAMNDAVDALGPQGVEGADDIRNAYYDAPVDFRLSEDEAAKLQADLEAAAGSGDWNRLLVVLQTAFDGGASIDDLAVNLSKTAGLSPEQKGVALRELLTYPGVEEELMNDAVDSLGPLAIANADDIRNAYYDAPTGSIFDRGINDRELRRTFQGDPEPNPSPDA